MTLDQALQNVNWYVLKLDVVPHKVSCKRDSSQVGIVT